ncbi:MAG: DUF3108 domain-containing protein [Brachymonas denitrificans]|uniref:DUF3108 domain-containing protein n=2 Tax=Brachymonas denitrificans TaxID=28220 RepID=UPI00352DD3D4
MPASRSSAPAARQIRPLPLLLAALAVAAAHALLLFGLPQQSRPAEQQPASEVVVSLETRTIVPEPEPEPEPPPPPPPPPRQPAVAPAPAVEPAPPPPVRVRRPPPPAQREPLEQGPARPTVPASAASAPEDAATSADAAASAPASASSDAIGGTGLASHAASAPAPAASAPAPIPAELIALSRAPAKAPPSFLLEYDMTGEAKKLQYHASGTLQWTNQGDQSYQMAYTISAFLVGKRTQVSQGRVGPNGLRPDRFADQWRGEKAASFTRNPEADPKAAQGTIQFSAGNPEVPLLPGAQDQVSMFVQLLALFNADAGRYPPGSTLLLQSAGPRNAPLFRFRVDPEETVHAGGQEHRAIKLTQVRSAGQNKRIEMWLAPWQSGGQTHYLPVRMRISEDNGNYVEQTLKRMPPG